MPWLRVALVTARMLSVLKRCPCVCAGRSCTLCLPLKFHCCSNSLASHMGLVANNYSGVVGTNEISLISDGAHTTDALTHSESVPANDSDPLLIS